MLVTETPNGEHYNVIPAMYANMGGGDPRMGQKAEGRVGWWGACGSRYTGEGGDCDLPVRWKALACTPICWMPMPPREDEKKLRRRLGQLLRHNAGLELPANTELTEGNETWRQTKTRTTAQKAGRTLRRCYVLLVYTGRCATTTTTS